MDAAAALAWPTARLQQQLQAPLPGITVQVLANTASTNTDLIERARRGDASPCLLVAETQSAGRGRNGRAWRSSAGASLTFSLAAPLAPRDWSGLSLAVGVALAEAIEPLPPGRMPRLQLKWPNDLWLADGPDAWRKLGGILIETVAAGDQRVCVVGIGINVEPIEADATFFSGYACAQELAAGIDAPSLLAALVLPLAQALRRFEADGFAPFAAAYARRDLLRGREVTTTLPALPAGTAEGVDDRGALLLRRGTVTQPLASGEVSVRPANRSGGAH